MVEGDVDPRNLNLGSRWRVSFKPWPHILRQIKFLYQLNAKPEGLLPLQGDRPTRCRAFSLVIILTELHRLSQHFQNGGP